MSFPFFSAIPQPGDNPSVSQASILQNFTSIGASGGGGSWVTQDHYGFGTGTDGRHKQVFFPANVSDPATLLLTSAIYSKVGSADSATSEAFFKNRTSTLLLSAIKAFAQIDGSAGTISNGSNVASATHPSTGIYNVTLTSGATSGTSYAVLTGTAMASSGSKNGQVAITYTITGANTITFTTINVANDVAINVLSFSFAILQF